MLCETTSPARMRLCWLPSPPKEARGGGFGASAPLGACVQLRGHLREGLKAPHELMLRVLGGFSGKWCHGEGLLAKRIRARGKLVVIPAPSWFGDEINAGLL